VGETRVDLLHLLKICATPIRGLGALFSNYVSNHRNPITSYLTKN